MTPFSPRPLWAKAPFHTAGDRRSAPFHPAQYVNYCIYYSYNAMADVFPVKEAIYIMTLQVYITSM